MTRAFLSFIFSLFFILFFSYALLLLLPEAIIDSAFFLKDMSLDIKTKESEFFLSTLYQKPVFSLILPFMMNSFILLGGSFIFAIIFSFLLSFWMFFQENKIVLFLLNMLLAIPLIILCFLGIYFLSIRWPLFSPQIIWEPTSPYNEAFWHSLALPFLILTISQMAILFKYLYVLIKTEKNKLYLTVAKAKGGRKLHCFFKHLLINIRLPYLHILFVRFLQLFSGTMIVEFIFSYPGVGFLTYEAVKGNDYPLAITLIALVALLIQFFYFILKLFSPYLDPRLESD